MFSLKKSVIFFTSFLILCIFFSSKVSAVGPSLKFVPSAKSVSTGDKFSVEIVIDTNGQEIGGAGAKFNYNPLNVIIESIDVGSLFVDYPSVGFDNTNGNATISGIVSSLDDLFTGTGVFATVNFYAISGPSTQVTFDFTPGDTTDSNLAVTYEPGDILNEVNTLDLSISGITVNPPVTEALPTTIVVGGPEPAQPGFFSNLVTEVKELINPKKDQIELDPYAPLPSQEPNRNTTSNQPRKETEGGNGIFVLVSLFIIVLLLVLVILIIKVIKKKRRDQSPPTIITGKF